MTITSSPPMRRSPIVMMVSSAWKVRLASLYGCVMRTHLVHAGHQLDQPRVDLAAADHAEHDARGAGRPVHVHAEFDELRDHRFDFRVTRPFLHYDNHDLISAFRFQISDFVLRYLFFVILLVVLRVAFRFDALNAARFVHDAFVQPRHRVAVERPAERFVHLPHVRDHRGLARRLVDRPAELDASTGRRCRRTARGCRAGERSPRRSCRSPRAARRGSVPQPSHVPLHFVQQSRATVRAPRSPSPARCRRPPRRPTARSSARVRAARCRSPSASGIRVSDLTRSASSRADSSTVSRTPVTPSREIPYRNPLPSSDARRIRSTVVVGLNRKIVSIPASAKAARNVLAFLGRHVQRQHAVDARRARFASQTSPSPSEVSDWRS